MTINGTTIVFFDSSCLIAASGSPTGGSSVVLAICARGFLRGAVSPAVLAEAEGNIITNLPQPALTRYRQEILSLPLIVAPTPSTAEREAVASITGEKDAHRKTHMCWPQRSAFAQRFFLRLISGLS